MLEHELQVVAFASLVGRHLGGFDDNDNFVERACVGNAFVRAGKQNCDPSIKTKGMNEVNDCKKEK